MSRWWSPRRSVDLPVEVPGEGPDGIAFGRGGDLYVALGAPFNKGDRLEEPKLSG